jgi:hypothetical protein
MKTTITIAAVAGLLALTACSSSVPEGYELRPVETEAEVSETTEAPTTTASPTTTQAPTTTPPPPPPPPPPSGYLGTTLMDCYWVNTDDTSYLVPDDWDQWCWGVLFAIDYVAGPEGYGVCAEFWASDDDDIADLLMSPQGGSNTWSVAVGMVDGMWLGCSS